MDFSALPVPGEDVILAAMLAYRADPRDTKIDLGVGVYKDENGNTPVMAAVREASRKLAETEETKAYTTLRGDVSFHDTMREIILADSVPGDIVHCAATTGGTQAVRILCELIKATAPDATLWISDPTWPNHPVIADHIDLARRDYHYMDPATREVDFAGMMQDLDAAREGDVVLLHACCHNPTGADLSSAQWAEMTAFLKSRRLTPFIDAAYIGFGAGIDEDAAPLRRMVRELPVVLIAASCSKNFGIYRDRAGLAMVVAHDSSVAARLEGTLTALNRVAFSFPPDHGARIVTMIWNDPELRESWQSELEANRKRVVANRKALADALRRESNSDRFDFLVRHQGMFSRLGASPEQVAALVSDHAIYMVGDSRMNVAGLVPSDAERIARAILDVGV